MDQQSVNRTVVVIVDLELIEAASRVFERILDAINLISKAVSLFKQRGSIGANHVKPIFDSAFWEVIEQQ